MIPLLKFLASVFGCLAVCVFLGALFCAIVYGLFWIAWALVHAIGPN